MTKLLAAILAIAKLYFEIKEQFGDMSAGWFCEGLIITARKAKEAKTHDEKLEAIKAIVAVNNQ